MLGAGLAFGTMYIAAGLLALLWYVLLAVGRWRMFEKMDQPGCLGFGPDHACFVHQGHGLQADILMDRDISWYSFDNNRKLRGRGAAVQNPNLVIYLTRDGCADLLAATCSCCLCEEKTKQYAKTVSNGF